MWFAIDTLEYLRRGGRIGGARAWIGVGAEDQADPHPRGGDHPGRAGPHPRRGRSSGCATTPASATSRAPTPGSSSTSRTPRRPTPWSTTAARSSAASRPSSPRSAPVLGAHVGPGLLGVGSVTTEPEPSLRVERSAARRRRRRAQEAADGKADDGGADDSCALCSRTWRRQSVSSVTGRAAPRPSGRGPGAGASMSRRISAAVRPGRPAVAGRAGSG